MLRRVCLAPRRTDRAVPPTRLLRRLRRAFEAFVRGGFSDLASFSALAAARSVFAGFFSGTAAAAAGVSRFGGFAALVGFTGLGAFSAFRAFSALAGFSPLAISSAGAFTFSAALALAASRAAAAC